jgi:hypothetical protein
MGKKQEFLIFFAFFTKNHVGLPSVPPQHHVSTCFYYLVRQLLGGDNSVGKVERFLGSRIRPLPAARPKTRKQKWDKPAEKSESCSPPARNRS